MEIPDGFADFFGPFPNENTMGLDPKQDQVFRVERSLYGLKQSPRQRAKKLWTILSKMGYRQLQSDNAIYVNDADKVILCTYVHDFLTGAESPAS